MNRILIKISEIVSIVCLIAFIMFITSENTQSDKNALAVAQQVASAVNLDGASERKAMQLKKQFGIEESEIDSFVYYSCDDVMDVRELLIIKLKDDSGSDRIYSAIEKRLDERKSLFESYAPEQSALLNNAVLISKSSFIFYAVGADSQEALTAFNNSL